MGLTNYYKVLRTREAPSIPGFLTQDLGNIALYVLADLKDSLEWSYVYKCEIDTSTLIETDLELSYGSKNDRTIKPGYYSIRNEHDFTGSNLGTIIYNEPVSGQIVGAYQKVQNLSHWDTAICTQMNIHPNACAHINSNLGRDVKRGRFSFDDLRTPVTELELDLVSDWSKSQTELSDTEIQKMLWSERLERARLWDTARRVAFRKLDFELIARRLSSDSHTSMGLAKSNMPPEDADAFLKLLDKLDPDINIFRSLECSVPEGATLVYDSPEQIKKILEPHPSTSMLSHDEFQDALKRIKAEFHEFERSYDPNMINVWMNQYDSSKTTLKSSPEWFAHDFYHAVVEPIKLSPWKEMIAKDLVAIQPNGTEKPVSLTQQKALDILYYWLPDSMKPSGAGHELNVKGNVIFDMIQDVMISYMLKGSELPKDIKLEPKELYTGQRDASEITIKPKSDKDVKLRLRNPDKAPETQKIVREVLQEIYDAAREAIPNLVGKIITIA